MSIGPYYLQEQINASQPLCPGTRPLCKQTCMIWEQVDDRRSFLGRRIALELCNFLFLMAGLASDDTGQAHPLNLTSIEERFEAYAMNHKTSWHPFGEGIPKFSRNHCSTGTVLLVQALLMCQRVRL